MDSETRRKVSEMVLDLVKKANMENATEFKIRLAASERLGIDLSDNASKRFVGSIVQSYLVALAKEKSQDAEKKKEEDAVVVVAANDDAEKNKKENEDVVVAAAAASNEEIEVAKVRRENCERIICRLSNRRNVAVKPFNGTTLVSLREFYMKDGKLLPGFKGISLTSEQWSTFKKSVPAIEEAIAKMEGRMRPELKGKQNEDASISVVDVAPLKAVPTDGRNSVVDVAPLKPAPTDGKNSAVDVAPLKHVPTDGKNSAVDVAPLKHVPTDGKNSVVDVAPLKPAPTDGKNSAVDVAPLKHVPTDGKNSAVDVAPLKPVPTDGNPTDGKNSVVDVAPLEPAIRFEVIEVIRFDGKNYQFWAQQMELLLEQLKIGYVLTVLCPNATLGEGASTEEIAAAKAAERRWLNDDLMCRRNILIHLSDHLFNLYANRKLSAKELWEELKLVYLYEEFGTKRSQVKKYIEFQIVDEKPVVEQFQELNGIADSIAAAGIFFDENFHVSVIISKLPPSWKDFSMKLMREEHLSFWKLMDQIQIEEDFRNGVKRVGEHSSSSGRFHQGNRGEQRRADYKPLGMYRNRPEINAKSVPCTVCGKRGHLPKNCWRRYDKQVNERKAEEGVRTPTEANTPGATQ